MYPKKVDKCVRIRDKKKQKGKTHMPNKNSPTKYSEEFKKTIVTLYQSGKTYAEIKKEYGVSSSALSKTQSLHPRNRHLHESAGATI